MIEKLPFTEIHTGGENMVDLVEYRTVTPYEMQRKINELVDVVNELQKKDTKKEPLDRYIKQRKWVGKLCKFEGENYGILKEIGCSDTKHVWRDGAFRSSDGYWYDFCEPVSPEDNIIYKGGENE